jgi:hypothetical protein
MPEDPSITRERLLDLRRATRTLSDSLENELKGYLQSLAPLGRPKRLLGDLIAGESTESYPEAEKAFQELQELYREVCQRPFRLHAVLSKPIPAIRVRLEIHPWEEAWSSPDGTRRLIVESPFAWILGYPGACSLRSLRGMLAGEDARNEEEIQQFVLNCCILHLLLERTPGFAKLLTGLRFNLETRHAPDLGSLPIPVIASVIPSVRPAADVMLEAAAMAGLGRFEEVVDPNAASTLVDPLRARLERALGGDGAQ